MLSSTLPSALAERWLLVATSISVLACALVGPKLIDQWRLYCIPIVAAELGNTEKRRQAYLAGSRKLYNQGYKKFQDSVFRITTSRQADIVVVSPKFLPELKKLSDSIVSMAAAVDETMETKYLKIETTVPIVPHTIKTSLTPALTRLNSLLAQEINEVLAIELPSSRDWAEVDVHEFLVRTVTMVSGRLFIGPELCRTPQYIDTAINYTMDVMAAQRAVQMLRPWQRPFAASRLAQVKKLAQREKKASEFLLPIIKARQEAAKSPDYDKPDDMLEWILDAQSKFTDECSQNIAKVQLGLSFAAIHTTTLTATNALYDLVALPDFIDELREEAKKALAENEGVFTSAALQSMKKMDSFLKETLRLHPATMASFQRKVLQTFSLSNGQVIPAGVTIEVPAVSVNSDPEIFPNPDKFDPLRFYKLRETAKDSGSVEGAALNQFVSVSQNSLTFGFGRHTCPGRFFAANEIKMILVNAVLRYDFKMPDGCTERFPNIEFAHMSIPDMKKLLARKIQDDLMFF
ncbi:cytochrome P450 [Microdochium trichocladiopsis]|uniref:Cytochrome P450 n=1 Tax=Microdochium trichocladiopsis TaxID=1682393 RepID=A0A9P8XUL2_9PEZI|nr:cytochrome P450 [Microdochium trichocladiopsis]KAH7012740.1 cytochrome P450 [Microdochium trichocladiopsis]